MLRIQAYEKKCAPLNFREPSERKLFLCSFNLIHPKNHTHTHTHTGRVDILKHRPCERKSEETENENENENEMKNKSRNNTKNTENEQRKVPQSTKEYFTSTKGTAKSSNSVHKEFQFQWTFRWWIIYIWHLVRFVGQKEKKSLNLMKCI